MHSRIFQISKNPIDEDDYIDADHYCGCDDEWFLASVADYVSDVDDRDAELDEWLSRFNGRGLEYDSEKETLSVIDRERFFAGKYAKFREMLQTLAGATLADFSGEGNYIGMDVYRLSASYEDKFAIYVDNTEDGTGLNTFDEFVRHAEKGIPYYLGGVVDYHA